MNPTVVIAAVNAFGLEPVIETYQRKTGKSADLIEQETRELRRYLALCILHPGRPLPMFTFADDLWHEFICHTRLYDRFCREVAGFFIHHDPYTGASPAGNGIDISSVLYERYFGPLPLSLQSSAECEGDSNPSCQSCSSGPSAT